jgi:Protein of unknown function (DUF3761)
MKNSYRMSLIAAPILMLALSLPAMAQDPTTCKDGSTSTATGKGACSGHGGVQKATKSSTAPAAPAAAPATPAAAPASGAGSTCKDGTSSTSSGKGACSGHGGVQKASSKPAAAVTPAPAAAPAAKTATPAAAPVAKTAAPAAAAPAAAKTSTATKSAPTTTASNTDPTGATAKCKDGTYSKSQHHSGTCSSHGGVDSWITQ